MEAGGELRQLSESMFEIYQNAKTSTIQEAKKTQTSSAESKHLAKTLSVKTFQQLEKQINELQPRESYPVIRTAFLIGVKDEFYTPYLGFPKEIENLLQQKAPPKK